MVEENKVLLGKVDTLKNVVDSLMKFVPIEKFSWYRGLECRNVSLLILLFL
jgi:hypothetical protein